MYNRYSVLQEDPESHSLPGLVNPSPPISSSESTLAEPSSIQDLLSSPFFAPSPPLVHRLPQWNRAAKIPRQGEFTNETRKLPLMDRVPLPAERGARRTSMTVRQIIDGLNREDPNWYRGHPDIIRNFGGEYFEITYKFAWVALLKSDEGQFLVKENVRDRLFPDWEIVDRNDAAPFHYSPRFKVPRYVPHWVGRLVRAYRSRQIGRSLLPVVSTPSHSSVWVLGSPGSPRQSGGSAQTQTERVLRRITPPATVPAAEESPMNLNELRWRLAWLEHRMTLIEQRLGLGATPAEDSGTGFVPLGCSHDRQGHN